jgi:hypothetical protein
VTTEPLDLGTLLDLVVEAVVREIDAEHQNEKRAASGKTIPRVGDFRRANSIKPDRD